MQNPLPDIRRASLQNATELAAIRAMCFHEIWQETTFAQMLADEKNICLIVPDTGYALAQKMPPEAELITIAVVPAYRRRGIAENLLLHLRQELQGCGIHTLHLEVNETQDAARNLYEKLGFAVTGRRKGYYRNRAGIREDAILMQWRTAL